MNYEMKVVIVDNEYAIHFINDQKTIVNSVKISYLKKYFSDWKKIQGFRVIQIFDWLKKNHPETML